MALLGETQSILQGPPKRFERPQPLIPHLETIDEDQSLKWGHGDLKEFGHDKGIENEIVKDLQDINSELWDGIQSQK